MPQQPQPRPERTAPRGSRSKRRWRIAFGLLPLSLLVFSVAAVFVAHHHYRLEWLYIVAAVCWLSAFAELGPLAFLAFQRRAVRAVAVGISVLAVLGSIYLAWVVHFTSMEGPRRVTDGVQSPEGRYELVVDEYSVWIDPAYDVWLRERHGLFARKVRVWTSREGPAPVRVAFVGPHEVEIVDTEGNTRRSTFDAKTLRLSQVHCLGNWC